MPYMHMKLSCNMTVCGQRLRQTMYQPDCVGVTQQREKVPILA